MIHQLSNPPPGPPGVNDIQMVRFSPSISPYHWNWFSAFCWFLQSKTFHGCQGESFLLKVNGFNWIFPKQKTDNGRNFVPISWLNMKVFWDTPQYTDTDRSKRSNSQTLPGTGMFCSVWPSMKSLLVCRSGDLDLDWCLYKVWGVDRDSEDEIGLSFIESVVLTFTEHHHLISSHSASRSAPTAPQSVIYWSRDI